MAYSELIKNFERIRGYMRQFYVYGFKSRSEYDQRSARSYDNERRRVESWLGDSMGFRQTAGGRQVFISVDSRAIAENPFYNAFRARSFTAGDITFHFYVLDLLAEGEALTARQIAEGMANYLDAFEDAEPMDESSIRKKLREYEAMGLLASELRGRERCYRRRESAVDLDAWREALAFFAEADPLGVIGSQLLDKLPDRPDIFRFKHHYLLMTLDSQVLCDLLLAMGERRRVTLTVPRGQGDGKLDVFPMKIFQSVQSGRQYLLLRHLPAGRYAFRRLDNIRAVVPGPADPDPERHMAGYDTLRRHTWGVNAGDPEKLDHVEMDVRVRPGEGFVADRLNREKRCGAVTQVDETTWRFTADVFYALELLPWIRTFTGRILRFACSDPLVEARFRADLEALRAWYAGTEEGGDGDAVQ